jgi:hypothetical protein
MRCCRRFVLVTLVALFATSSVTAHAQAPALADGGSYFAGAEEDASANIASLFATGTEAAPPDGNTAACGCQPAECNCPACQAKKAADLKKAVAGAYANPFYNNNFSYLNNPAYDDCHFGENLKQIPIGDCWLVDLGGQYRARYHGEQNMRGLGLTGNDDNFLLHRTRLFANAKYSDWFRFYGEYIDAESNYENFPPRAIEVNRSDMLNLFADARAFDGDTGDLWFRIGRQELLYGSERLISPLDWANTRRTFDGFKFFYQGQDWNIDFFATRPVIVDPIRFDNPSYDQEFMGAWATYKARPGHTYDFYAIQFNNMAGTNNFQYSTLGARWLGSEESWLWDAEGGVQFGDNTDGTNHQAAFTTGGVGYKWADRCWQPTLWFYYDWASGGDVAGAGQGFNHLFPLAHRYLGYMDLFARSNIQSPNVQLNLQPTTKLKAQVWYYYLFLDTLADTPYNVNMSPFAPASPPASRDLGHEIDFLFTYSINARMDLLFGYSHFTSGEYYDLTPGLPHRGNADFFYVQYHWNF